MAGAYKKQDMGLTSKLNLQQSRSQSPSFAGMVACIDLI